MCENSAQQKCNTRKENGLQLGAINQRHIKQLQLLPIDEETNLLQLTNEEFEQQSLLDVIDNSIKELREQFGLLVTETEDNIYQYDIYKLKLEAAKKYLFLLHQKQPHQPPLRQPQQHQTQQQQQESTVTLLDGHQQQTQDI